MNTKRILAREASPDMVLAEDVYTCGGQNIISKGTVLDNRAITRLKFYSITEIVIEIEDEAREKVDFKHKKVEFDKDSKLFEFAQENIRKTKEHKDFDDNYVEIIRSTEEYVQFNSAVMESAKVLEDSLSTFITRAGIDLNTNDLLNHTKEIIVMNRNPLNTFHMLQNMRKYDDVTFIHSLNVAIVCNVFARWIHMPQEDIDILTLAGLLHDVGKMEIPENIIKKPRILTDEEYSIVKLHPRRGYHLVENLRIDDRIKKVILMHHERCDGSGYPDHLVGDEISDFSKIVAIADIYDAMTSARIYRGPLCPYEVINVFEEEGFEKFEAKYLIPFLEGIVNAHLNSEVVLSDGRVGVVVLNNKNALSKPVIKIGTELIDLSRESDLKIQRLA